MKLSRKDLAEDAVLDLGVSKAISGILRPGRTRSAVVPGLVPGIHVLVTLKNVDGRDEHGHDGQFAHAAVVRGGNVARMSKSQFVGSR